MIRQKISELKEWERKIIIIFFDENWYNWTEKGWEWRYESVWELMGDDYKGRIIIVCIVGWVEQEQLSSLNSFEQTSFFC